MITVLMMFFAVLNSNSFAQMPSLTLQGEWEEIGRAAAKAASVPRSESMAEVLNQFISKHIEQLSSFSPISTVAKLYINQTVYRNLKNSLPEEERDMLAGVNKEWNVPQKGLERAFLTPEAMNSVLLLGSDRHRALSPLLSCSSFYAAHERTQSGERILGRNLDFPGVNSLDYYSSVYYFNRQNAYRILSIAPQGFPIPGISGMNEKGLVLILHEAYSAQVSKRGRPIFSVNREVLETTSTIEEAIEVYKKYQYEAGWLVHLSDRDPKTGQARSAIVELGGAGVDVLWGKDSYSVLTNSYRSSRQKSFELFIAPGVEIHNHDRLQRLDQLVTSEKIDLSRAFNILSDSYSPYSASMVDYSVSSIRAIDQVNSMVFLPDQLKVMVSTSADPASNGTYYEYSFSQMDQKLAPRLVSPQKNDLISESHLKLVQAYLFDFQKADFIRSAKLEIESDKLAVGCGLSLLAGAAHLRLDEIDEAKSSLLRAISCSSLSPHHQILAHFYLAMTHWGLGDVLLAKEELSLVIQGESALLNKTGIPGDRTLIKLSHLLVKRIEKGREISKKEIHQLARLDIKVMDNLYGWNLSGRDQKPMKRLKK